MDIRRDNYEAYFLDHLEGRLSAGLEVALRGFLESNPDLAEELRSMESAFPRLLLPIERASFPDRESLIQPDLLGEDLPVLKPESVVFAGKSFLKKELPVTASDTEALIAAMEGDLPEEALRTLERRVAASPALRRERELVLVTRLVPETVVFDGKASLYRKAAGRVVPMNSRWLAFTGVVTSAAAVMVFWLGSTGPSSDASMAGRFDSQLGTLTAGLEQPVGVSTGPGASGDGRGPVASEDGNGQPVFQEAVHHIGSYAEEQRQPMKSRAIGALAVSRVEPDIAPDMRMVHSDPSQFAVAKRDTYDGEFLTVWEFAEQKAKQRLWGGEDFPEEKFAEALARREVDRRLGDSREALYEIRRVKQQDRKQFSLRLGKFFRFSRSTK